MTRNESISLGYAVPDSRVGATLPCTTMALDPNITLTSTTYEWPVPCYSSARQKMRNFQVRANVVTEPMRDPGTDGEYRTQWTHEPQSIGFPCSCH